MKFLKSVLLWTWCLPQSILGFLLYMFFWVKKEVTSVDYISSWGAYIIEVTPMWFSGISLGAFIIINFHYGVKTRNHEHGHVIQSLILGPFYLLFVGLPSIIRATLSIFSGELYENYYKGYPENWADKLGGVVR